MYKLLSVPSYLTLLLIDKGFIYLLSFIISYIYVTIRQTLWKKRLDLYDFAADGQPEKNGFFVPTKEWELESPRSSRSLKTFSDDAYIFGTNSKSECLAIHVARIPENQVRCSVVLRLQDGKLYFLPKEFSLQRATTEDHTFGSSRLKLQCLSPMRKWRVFFNGILEEYSDEVNQTEIIHEIQPKRYKHVRFTFLWAAASDVFDFSNGMSKLHLAHSAATETSITSFPVFLLQKLHSIFDRYEQGGMFQGTLRMENEPEKEIYLWGGRGRSFGKIANLYNAMYKNVVGNFKNGNVVRISIFNIPGLVKRFVNGYVMRSDGFVYPIDEFHAEESEQSNENMVVKISAGGRWYNIKIGIAESKEAYFQNEYGGPSTVTVAKIVADQFEGHGFIFNGTVMESERPSNKKYSVQICSYEQLPLRSPLTVPFDNIQCQSAELCGGKGSSLGVLFALSKQSKLTSTTSKFLVPNGIVVTTVGHVEFTNNDLEQELQKFEMEIWSNQQKDISQLCKKTVSTVGKTQLPESVKRSIAMNLKAIFGDSFPDRKFAVRSSATGEDTDQMSAAGQMETFLGLQGLDQIFASVSKCWASQFTFQAVEYKRRYGQHLNTPMAVVIQEMVPCDVAGVIFTCDPVSGNPAFISITANWGLGESVVSATAEPDTVTLARNAKNGLQVHSTEIGKKRSKIVMDGMQGTKEITIEDDNSEICCISEKEALRLGRISVEIENEYGSSRDLEWGISGGKVFLFQSRPVTSLDMETDFETEHHTDSPLRCEGEILTRGHLGEIMPGALSTLGYGIFGVIENIGLNKQYIRSDGGDNFPDKPYFPVGVISHCGAMFFGMISGYFRYHEENDDFTKPFLISMLGRLIDDKEIREMAKERHSGRRNTSLKTYFEVPYYLFNAFFYPIYCWWVTRKYSNFKIPLSNSKSSYDTLLQIAKYLDKCSQTFGPHITNSLASSFWNASVLKLLSKAEGDWDNLVYNDFAYLLSTCTRIESADVPTAIQELAYTISKTTDPASFKNMKIEDAVNWLQGSTSSDAGRKFKTFLQRHGHRCFKEMDMYSKVWKTNIQPLVKMLQEMVSEDAKSPIEKKVDSFPVILSKLKIKLNVFQKLKLFWMLPNTMRAVRWREYSKSTLILSMNTIREAFEKMAEEMVLEGRLPRKEYLYFLSMEELRQLSQTRYPRLVIKAARRFQKYEKMDGLLFPEFITGVPRPMNVEKIPTANGFCMKGVPVSQGIVKGTARVVISIKEASNIKQGDILIAYSTDIAWSPYFPLLSGVVTELGGLISHGAVVAREYGLPCVVSLHGATRAFTSGDLVVLDGSKGTLQKVEGAQLKNSSHRNGRV